MPTRAYRVQASFATAQNITTRGFTQDDTFVAQRDAEALARKLVQYHGAEKARVVRVEPHTPDGKYEPTKVLEEYTANESY